MKKELGMNEGGLTFCFHVCASQAEQKQRSPCLSVLELHTAPFQLQWTKKERKKERKITSLETLQ